MKNKAIRKHNIGNKGMSLVEVIVAVVLLSIVIIPVLQSFVYSARANSRARTLQKATVAAQTIMENYKAYPVEDICQQFVSDTFMVGSGTGVNYHETVHDLAGGQHIYMIDNISYGNSIYDAQIRLTPRSAPISVNAYQDSDSYCDAVYMVETDNAHRVYETVVNEAQARWSALSKADTEPEYYDVKQLNFDRRVEIYVDETPEGKITVKVKEVYSFQTYFRYIDDTGHPHGGAEDDPNNAVQFWGYAMPDADNPGGPFIMRYNPDWATEVSPPMITIYDNSSTFAESGGRAVLKNIYFYFYPLYVTSASDHWINGDIITVDSNGYTRADGEKLNFYAIKQKSPISATELEVREAAAYNSERINFTLKGQLMMYDNLNVNVGRVDAGPVPFTSPNLEGGAARAGSLHADPENKIFIYDIEVKLYRNDAVKIDSGTGIWSIDSGEQPIFTLTGTIND